MFVVLVAVAKAFVAVARMFVDVIFVPVLTPQATGFPPKQIPITAMANAPNMIKNKSSFNGVCQNDGKADEEVFFIVVRAGMSRLGKYVLFIIRSRFRGLLFVNGFDLFNQVLQCSHEFIVIVGSGFSASRPVAIKWDRHFRY